MPDRTEAPPRPKLPTVLESPAPVQTAEPVAAPVSQPVSEPGADPDAASPANASPTDEADLDYPLTHESFKGIFSSNQRAGRWEASDEIEIRAICGDVTLDFTRAELPPSLIVEIDAWTLCGNIEIIVPDGADVELEATPVIGSIEQQIRKRGAREAIREWVTGERDDGLPPPPATREIPYFRIDARAILGNVTVKGR